jgi:hypothetical protein
MEWFSAGSCPAAALDFGWQVGTASGLWAMALVIALIASAPAYRADVPVAVNATLRKYLQWLLFGGQLSLLIAWGAGACHVGRDYFPCYITTLALGAMSVIAPLMLLMMFTAANWVGRASAR